MAASAGARTATGATRTVTQPIVITIGEHSCEAGYASEPRATLRLRSIAKVGDSTPSSATISPMPQLLQPTASTLVPLWTPSALKKHQALHCSFLKYILKALEGPSSSASSSTDGAASCDTPFILLLPWALYTEKECVKLLCRLCLDEIGVPAVHCAASAGLACIGSGLASALVLDVGYRQATALVVSEGVVVRSSAVISPLGGTAVDAAIATHYLVEKDVDYGTSFSASVLGSEEAVTPSDSFISFAKAHLLEELKMSICGQPVNSKGVAQDPVVGSTPDGGLPTSQLVLQVALFPAKNTDSLAYTVISAKRKTDVELRGTIPVLCTGATTAAKSFVDVLQLELKKLDAMFYKASPTLVEPSASWRGGALISTSAAFSELWITSAELAAKGDVVFEQKLL